MSADNSLNFRYCRSFCHLEVNSTHYFDQTIYTIGAPYLAKNSCVITATGSLQKQKRHGTTWKCPVDLDGWQCESRNENKWNDDPTKQNRNEFMHNLWLCVFLLELSELCVPMICDEEKMSKKKNKPKICSFPYRFFSVASLRAFYNSFLRPPRPRLGQFSSGVRSVNAICSKLAELVARVQRRSARRDASSVELK